MKHKKQVQSTNIVTVIVDCRDGSKDRLVPREIAKKLYDVNILAYDLTSGKYCVPTNGKIITELLQYPQKG